LNDIDLDEIESELDEEEDENENQLIGGSKKSTKKTKETKETKETKSTKRKSSTKENNEDEIPINIKKRNVQINEYDEETDLIYPSLRRLLLDNISSVDISEQQNSQGLRMMKNHLAKHNQDMKDSVKQFISKYGEKKSCSSIKLLDSLMVWNNVNFGLELESTSETIKLNKISDDTGYNCINFIKCYIQNFVKTFPNVILNKVDYSNIKIQTYWGLSESHTRDVKSLVKKYYSELNNFYSDKYLFTLLSEIQTRGGNLIKLANETPYFTSFQSVFDKVVSSMLFEHYFLLVLMEYINLSETEMVLSIVEDEKENLGDVYTVESVEESKQYLDVVTDVMESQDILEGNKMKIKKTIASLICGYLSIMQSHKDIVDDSYDSIMDKVFKLREKEKNNVTDRKKKMSQEERSLDTVLQSNKLGIWSKGLEKGLTVYQKETYDDERIQAEEFANLERELKKKNPNVNDDNIEEYMEDFIEQVKSDREIEKEEYDLSRMTENYFNGNPYGDEQDDDDEFYDS
jgi:hypothetical protein